MKTPTQHGERVSVGHTRAFASDFAARAATDILAEEVQEKFLSGLGLDQQFAAFQRANGVSNVESAKR